MSNTFMASTHVWVRELAHEAGTVFEIVDEPAMPTEISRDLAERLERNGWGKIERRNNPSSALRAPSPSKGDGGNE